MIIIEIAIMPSSASVVAAFLLLGRLKAGTPLEIASTPVSAAQPEEKARDEQEEQPDRGERALPPWRRRDVQVGALGHRQRCR